MAGLQSVLGEPDVWMVAVSCRHMSAYIEWVAQRYRLDEDQALHEHAEQSYLHWHDHPCAAILDSGDIRDIHLLQRPPQQPPLFKDKTYRDRLSRPLVGSRLRQAGLDPQTALRHNLWPGHHNISPVRRHARRHGPEHYILPPRHTLGNERTVRRAADGSQPVLETRVGVQVPHRHSHPGRLQDGAGQAVVIEEGEPRVFCTADAEAGFQQNKKTA